MKTTIPKLRRMIQEALDENYYDQEAEDIRDEHRGYKEEEGEDKIYSPEFGWVTPEELAELESQMYETAQTKGNTMKLSKRRLKRIILEEKQKIMLEMLDISDSDVSELLSNLLDGMERSEVSPWYWREMLKVMRKIGPEKTLMVFEKAVDELDK